MTKFNKILKELRLEFGLSQKELAEKIMVSERTISYWELGQRECNLEQLVQLSKIFDISTDYLLGIEK